MFLVKSEIPTEPVWTAFIASAAELTLRRRVPPPRPGLPDLLPKIPPHVDDLKRNCWAYDGDHLYLGVSWWPDYAGASHLPLE